ncbi:MAG: hypothetical protein ACI81P_002646, partial [Neolewinella sp.]
MQEAKVVRQITAMDGRERERLRHFVRSPYFNRHKATSLLLDFVLKELGKTRPKLEEARAQEAVKVSGTGQSLADLQSSLMKLVNQFLAVEQLGEESFRQEVLTLKRTKELHRFSLLENRGKRLEAKVAKHKYRDGDTHLAAYEWKSINGYLRGATNRSDTREMEAMLNHLDRFYMVEKLRHACQLTANMLMMNTHYEFLLLEPVLEYLEGKQGEALLYGGKEPSIDCYYHILMSLRKPDKEQHYERMLYYLNDGFERLPLDHQKDVYSFASNYCIQRIRSGHAAYRSQLMDLYRRGIDIGIIYDKGEISEYDYKNIVTLGSANKEFEWTERFIEENRERLPAAKRDNAYALNKASFLYALDRLDEAARLLVRVTDSDIVYHLARVVLEVRIAYDQQDQEYALNLLETFRLYVRRSRKMSTKDKRSYINYTRFTKQLVNLKHQEEYLGKATYEKRMEALAESVQAADLAVERGWLLREAV